MATVAVLGMGLLGRGFAHHLLDEGHTVHVWNRTASKCDPLAEAGATVASSPAEAARGADRVHLVLHSDAAVDAVVGQLREGLGAEVPVVDHSTNLPAAVADRFAALRAEGVRYLHAPVFMGPTNSREGTGLMLLCGPDDDHRALRPALEAMTGQLLYLGPAPDQAAKIKITGNGMLVMLIAAMGDLFALGRASGLAPDDIVGLFEQFSPTPAAMGRRALASAEGPVGFEMTMARKDVRLMIETAGGRDRLRLLPAIADAMDAAIDAGRGSDDFTSLAHPDHLP